MNLTPEIFGLYGNVLFTATFTYFLLKLVGLVMKDKNSG